MQGVFNTRLRRYKRLAPRKDGYSGTGQAAFPTKTSLRTQHHDRVAKTGIQKLPRSAILNMNVFRFKGGAGSRE